MTNEIRIYIADLAAYNNGYLHGVWIDATEDSYAQQDAIQAMLAASPIAGAEEYAIHDYEGFEGVKISEWEGLEQVQTIARFIAEHGKLGAELLAYYADVEEAKEAMQDRYHGCFQSVADYAADFMEQSCAIPEHLANYIDYERMARDFEYSGDIFTIIAAHDEVHIFSSC